MTYKTPMLQQYQAIKEQYPDCLLFFRLGDFYELFGDDAKIGSEVLHITLTARSKGSDGQIPMCGVPFHASENYIARLVNAGYKVAICEQLSDPPAGGGKGLVNREVVRVVTAGTLLRDESLTEAASQYILSLVVDPPAGGKVVAGAAADLSTGSFLTFSFKAPAEEIVPLLISHFAPRECIVPQVIYDNRQLMHLIRHERQINVTCVHDWLIYTQDAEAMLRKQFAVQSLTPFGLTNKPEAVKGAAALLGYLRYTQKGDVAHIKTMREFHFSGHLVLDATTLRHLEVIRTTDGEVGGSLFGTLNHTAMAAGQRLLQEWLLHPITNRTELANRHEAVTELLSRPSLVNQIHDAMTSLADIERLVGRLSVGLGSPRDLRRLVDTLWHIHATICPLLSGVKGGRLRTLAQDLEASLLDWVAQIREQTFEEAKPTLDEGFIFKTGFYPELDTLRELTSGNQSWLNRFEAQERERTSISKLKVVYSRAFGYAIEISKTHRDKVPADYVPRQTLVNADRFTCQALVEYEQQALSAMDQMIALEKQLFADRVNEVIRHAQTIAQSATQMAQLDVLTNFATIAQANKYTKPTLTEEVGIMIKGGRHPVIEQISELDFVANDTILTLEQSLQLITGPNMAGKSTYIRQVALIVLLAHTGSFVSATEARIGIIDRIFTRIGAHDNLRAGQSTFMVEMLETAHILTNATERSLIILDEVGRGTSPEDGFALAWAIAEALVQDSGKGLVLFATHFHALKDLAKHHSRAFNSHLAVAVDKNDLIFLRKVTSGPTDESFGIVVAQKAGVPAAIIKRAQQLAADSPYETLTKKVRDPNQLPLLAAPAPSPLENRLKAVNINALTPLQALQLLNELQNDLE